MSQKSSYNIKIDGYEASTSDEKVMNLVNYLLGKIDFWRDISNTYKKSIDIMFDINQRSGKNVGNKR